MARRTKKTDALIGGAVLIIGIPMFVGQKITDAGAWPIIIIGALGIAACLIYVNHRKKAARLAYLQSMYDEATVQRILNGDVWHGMTSGQLLDSLGKPHAVDQKHLKTKTREIWKYRHQGANRYGLRITVDDDCVAGWDSKS